MHVEFGKIINEIADTQGKELSATQIRQAFDQAYLHCNSPFQLKSFHREASVQPSQGTTITCVVQIAVDGIVQELHATGNGPIDAFMQAMKEELVPDFTLLSYAEHSLGQGSEAEAIAYIQIQTPSGETFFGASTDTNIELASIKAVVCALNRAMQSHGGAQRTRANQAMPVAA